jgi:SAM-dependent methyltransferase
MQNDNLKDNGSMWSNFSKEECHSFLQSEELGKNHPARIFVRDLVKKIGGGTLLDIPCGSGADAEVLADVCTYSGMDKTQILVDTVAERYGVETKLGDIRQIPLQDNSYDIVLARAIFEHLTGLQDVERSMRECLRVAKHDAIFAFYLPLNGATMINWNGVYFENRYHHSEIERILNDLGAPYEQHYVNVEGTHYVDSYTIYHVTKAGRDEKPKKSVKSKPVAVEAVGTEEPKKRTRKKKD